MKFQIATYGSNNAVLHIYSFDISKEGLTPRLLVASPSEPKSLSGFIASLPSTQEPVLAINGGVFETYQTLLKYPYGLTYVNQVQKNRSATSDDYNSILDLYATSSGLLKLEDADASYGTSSNNTWLRSGAYNLIKEGVRCTTPPRSDDIFTSDTAKTVIAVDSSNHFVTIISVAQNTITGDELASFLEEYVSDHPGEIYNAIGLDGGNSTTLWANGEIKINRYLVPLSERPITDVIVFTRNVDNVEKGYKLVAKNTPFRVRKHVVSGTIDATVPVGSSAEILQFIPGFQTDGYQWARVKYTDSSGLVFYGYSQLDTSSDYLVTISSTSPSPIYLKATNLGFYIRESPVTGTVKKLVTKGNRARIITPALSFASDGYQWTNVTYYENNTSYYGYSQMDLQEAYTIES